MKTNDHEGVKTILHTGVLVLILLWAIMGYIAAFKQ